MDFEKDTSTGADIEAPPSLDIETNNPLDELQPNDLVLPTWRLAFLAISLCIGLFLSLLDTSIVATALYTIGQDLHSVQTITWVALAYTLVYLSFCIIIARLADIIGRRNAWVLSLTLFLSFSLGCGFSQSLHSLIACRALQGIGGAGLYSITFVIMPEIAPPRIAGYLGGLVGAVVACAGVLGPVLGGLITHYATWRWVFWINAPIGVISFALFLIAWPKAHMLAPVQKRPWKDFDFVGSILVIAASVLVVFPLQESGVRSNIWNTALFICPLVLGCICWCLLFGWEFLVSRFWKSQFASMFPLRLVKHHIYMAYVIATLLTGFPFFVVIYALPLRFQVVNGKTPLTAGVGLLPMLGAVAVGSTIGGGVNNKKNNIFPVLVTASCLMTLGTGLMSTLLNTVNVESKTYGFQVLIGLAFGLTVSTVSLGAGLAADLDDATVGQGIVAQMRVLGGSIGIAASTAILGVHQRNELLRPGIITEEQLATLQTATRNFSPDQLHAVRQAYSNAFNEDMRICAVVSGLCILITLGTFRKNTQPIMERRKEQFVIEQKRLRELLTRTAGRTARKETTSAA
ncbi:Rubrofusarin-specific efflux pump aurT [Hyphodiscus hymeniophilus]|uniref:Rubrofusarin-specific efflux pump aurT n=1 Tax=Hyphodiscus hymeniophilus TaxID=353542 RepID=A0A9P6SLF3_9HELO|nr:Rubrofusarin-specific efflux pump aurT [Hyphodiscus hymeniophilus]